MFDGIKTYFRDKALTFLGYGSSGGVTLTDWNNDDKPKTDYPLLSVVTFYACIRNIAEDIAKLPKRFIRNENRGGLPVRIPFDDDLSRVIFDAPNPNMTGFGFWSLMEHWELGWGNAYADQEYKRGTLINLWPIHPSRVWPKMKNGVLLFDVYSDDGRYVTYLEEELFRLWGMSSEGRIGYNPAYLLQMTTGLARSAKKFANAFFNNGARPSGVLVTLESLSDEQRARLRTDFAKAYGGAENAGKIPLLEAGIEYKPFAQTMDDMKFNEMNEYTDEEIARFFRMPLYKLQRIKGAQGWSTLDAQETDYASSCLAPRICSIEQQIRRQLMYGYPPNVWPHFEMKGLMRGDVNSRQLFYNCLFAKGAITPNEIRVLEDIEPSAEPAANECYIQQGFVPIRIVEKVATQASAPKQPGSANENSNAPTSRLDGVHSNGTENASLLRNGTAGHAH